MILKKIICTLCILMLCTGCVSKVEKYNNQLVEIIAETEFSNMFADMTLFFSSLNSFYEINDEIIADESLSEDEKIIRCSACYIAYLNAIHEIAYNRVSAELDNIDLMSDEYMKYIALLQCFIDSYDEDIEFMQNHLIIEEDYLNNGVSMALTDVEQFYIAMSDDVEFLYE